MIKRLRKFCAIFLIAFTLINTTAVTYVQASEVQILYTILDAFLSMWGLSTGYGNQYDSIQDATLDCLNEVADSIRENVYIDLPLFGSVNVGDLEQTTQLLLWAMNQTPYIINGAIEGYEYSDDVVDNSKILDAASYTQTGTSATNSMTAMIEDFLALDELDQQDALSNLGDVLVGSASVLNPATWQAFTAIASAFTLAGSEGMLDWVNNMTLASDTVYLEDSNAFEKVLGYIPGMVFHQYSDTADPEYETYKNYVVVYSGVDEYNQAYKLLYYEMDNVYPYCTTHPTQGYYMFRCIKYTSSGYVESDLNLFKTYKITDTYYAHSSSSSAYGLNMLYMPFPVFSDYESSYECAKSYYFDGDESLVENLADVTAYPIFKENTVPAYEALADPLENLVTTFPTTDTLTAALPEVLDEDLIAAAGTDDAIPIAKNKIAALTGAEPVKLPSEQKGSVNLLNAFMALLYILFRLLMIFLHCLEFIVNVFKIPATEGFIAYNEDFAMGFNYIKSVDLSLFGMSVYDFMMGLIHIGLFFGVIGIMKRNIDRTHM